MSQRSNAKDEYVACMGVWVCGWRDGGGGGGVGGRGLSGAMQQKSEWQ